MTALKSSIAVVFAIALAGVAVGAPKPHDNLGVTGAAKGDPQLDRAALFRPAQVGECSAIAPRHAPRSQPARARDATIRANGERRTMANVGCNVVWSD